MAVALRDVGGVATTAPLITREPHLVHVAELLSATPTWPHVRVLDDQFLDPDDGVEIPNKGILMRCANRLANFDADEYE